MTLKPRKVSLTIFSNFCQLSHCSGALCSRHCIPLVKTSCKSCIVTDPCVQPMIQDELVNELKKQNAALEKTNKNQLQENAEEINRLHRSLKDSQQECRELLEARSSF